MQLEKNFKLVEFACKDGTSVPEELMDNVKLLAKNLQVIRDYIESPLVIISGYRSKKYNTRIGGARRSQHMLAKAGDLQSYLHTPPQLKEIIEKLIKDGKIMKGGVGLYNTFVHYDVRGRNARWRKIR